MGEDSRRIFGIAAFLIVTAFSIATEAAPTPVTDPATECQSPIIKSVKNLILMGSSTSAKTAVDKILGAYEQYAKYSSRRYVLCFSSTFDLGDPIIGIPTLSSALITGKPGKPLVVYGLTWKRLDVPVGSPLLTVAGEQVLLQGATITSNATAVRLEGTQHGIFQSTIKGWELEGEPPAVTAVVTGANHRIWQSTIADGGTAIRAEGTETVITDNKLGGSQFGVYLTSAARKVSVIKNAYTGVFANCPLVGSTATHVRCLVYLEPGANEATGLLSASPEEHNLFLGTKLTKNGFEYLDALYHFRKEPGKIEALQFGKLGKALYGLYPFSMVELSDSPAVREAVLDALLSEDITVEHKELLPSASEAPYVAVQEGIKIGGGGYVAILYHHPEHASQGISDVISVGGGLAPSGGVGPSSVADYTDVSFTEGDGLTAEGPDLEEGTEDVLTPEASPSTIPDSEEETTELVDDPVMTMLSPTWNVDGSGCALVREARPFSPSAGGMHLLFLLAAPLPLIALRRRASR